jgi:hypothetical protein
MKTHTSDSCHSRRHGRHARKERVLHTRISEQLSDDIRKFADDLRLPASNLVRNVLEEVFTVVDGVSEDVGDLFDDLIEGAEGVRERVRKQAASGRHRSHRGSGRRRRRTRGEGCADRDANFDDDDDVDAEFERDEAAEETGSASAKASGSPDMDEASSTEARPRAAELFPEILGWQPLVLNRDFECGRCKRNLAAGESAFLGLGEKGLTRTALCGRCAGSR